MENNFLSGGITELEAAKNAVAAAEKAKNELDIATAEASAREKDFESQKKYINDKTSSAIKERRGELKKSQDELVSQANKNLKEAEKKRKDAKYEAVQTRITSETASLSGKVDELKRQVKVLFRENKVPGFCNSKFYYALYAPKSASEFLILIITVLIAFGAIPNIVCACLKTDELFVKIMVYLAIVVFFVLIYFLVFLITKRNTKGPVLEQARPIRDAIKEEKKIIKKTSRTIEQDKDESGYGLEGHDAEIEQLQQALNESMQKRDDALSLFDNQTAQEIRDEIQKEHQAALDETEAALQSAQTALETAKENAANTANHVAEAYEVYLGKKNTTPEKIDSLIGLIREGKASTIMEALDVLNGEIK